MIAAPSASEEAAVFGELLKVARHERIDVGSPDGVARLVEVIVDTDAPDEPDAEDAVGCCSGAYGGTFATPTAAMPSTPAA